jgi:hypothetical protein
VRIQIRVVWVRKANNHSRFVNGSVKWTRQILLYFEICRPARTPGNYLSSQRFISCEEWGIVGMDVATAASGPELLEMCS